MKHKNNILLFTIQIFGTLASTISDTYSSDSLFQSSVLAAHNALRLAHSAPPLTWNSTLASFGSDHAAICVFKHSGGPFGENIAAGYSNTTAAVDAWGNEGDLYVYDPPLGFTKATGHFTQVVWKTTTSVGCGRTFCEGVNGTPGYFVVCEYFPRGNIVGKGNQRFIENVLPPDTDPVASSSGELFLGSTPAVTQPLKPIFSSRIATALAPSTVLTLTPDTVSRTVPVVASTLFVTVTRTRTKVSSALTTTIDEES